MLMKKEQKLEIISTKIRELVPRLMELSFGCEFFMSYDGEGIVCESQPDSYGGYERIIIWNTKNEEMYDTKESQDIRKSDLLNTCEDGWNEDYECFIGIIGHPITLFDIKGIIKDKHYLIDNWNNKPYLSDQEESFLEWIDENILDTL